MHSNLLIKLLTAFKITVSLNKLIKYENYKTILHSKRKAKIEKIADANLSMPPKSTYILPKLRNGLTIYEL